MSMQETWALGDTGKWWSVGSNALYPPLGHGLSAATVIIPTDQIDGLSDDEIIMYIRELSVHAENLVKEEQNQNDEALKDSPCCEKREREIIPGYIYVIKWHGHYKIGRTSRTPDERLAEISPLMPTKPKLFYYYAHHDTETEEKYLHSLFEVRRSNGEWFNLCGFDLDYIKGRA